MHHVVLYTRLGCHLCEDARAVVLAVRERYGFAFEEVDVDADDALADVYGLRVPVVSVDGEERFEISVDPASLASLVRM